MEVRMILLVVTWMLQTTLTPAPRGVMVTLRDANGRPVAEELLQLTIRRPLTRQECTTDAAGQCQFALNSSEELVQGLLLVVGRGQRSLLWKGERLEIDLQLTTTGQLDIPVDFTGPPAPPIQTAVAVTPTAITPVASPTEAESLPVPTEAVVEASPVSVGTATRPLAVADIPAQEVTADIGDGAEHARPLRGATIVLALVIAAVVIVAIWVVLRPRRAEADMRHTS